MSSRRSASSMTSNSTSVATAFRARTGEQAARRCDQYIDPLVTLGVLIVEETAADDQRVTFCTFGRGGGGAVFDKTSSTCAAIRASAPGSVRRIRPAHGRFPASSSRGMWTAASWPVPSVRYARTSRLASLRGGALLVGSGGAEYPPQLRRQNFNRTRAEFWKSNGPQSRPPVLKPLRTTMKRTAVRGRRS